MPTSPPLSTRDIRAYYDRNTRLFLALGSSPRADAIHRSVWAPGVETLDQALDYTNSLILDEIRSLAPAHSLERLRLADLGCGVGGTLFSLLPRLPAPPVALGLTISPVQAHLARQRAARLGLLNAVHFIEADFLAPPLPTGMDLAWSVEAFLHAPNPGAYFQGVSRLLRPGGRLIVCDDFLARPRAAPAGSLTLLPSSSETQWIAALQDGWHAPGLLSLEEAGALARGCGLHLARSLDLTPHLRLRALPDPLAQVLLWLGQRLPLRHPILPSMLGSLALQQCLRNGWIQYCFVVFEKVG